MNLGLGLSLGARGGGGGFTPAALSGVAHWYRADQGITLNAGNVAQWNDLVGSAHLVQATGANQPAYNATDAAYNNQPTIQASATGHYLAAAGVSSLQPMTLWIIGQNSPASTVLVALSTSGPWVANDGTHPYCYAGTSLIDTAKSANTPNALAAVFNGASSTFGANDWLTGGVSGNAGAGNGSSIGVFATSTGTFSTIGKIAELIIQAGVPTAAEKNNMAAYFARYGITVT